jgi:glutaryl-CoA dehydrogenase
MRAIHKHGSEERKQEWLPAMAAGEAIGCFGLTEPSAGSDPGSMTTFARRDGSDWVPNGTKRWIGLASAAQVAVVWAQTDEGVRGFVVPTSTPGFTATPIDPKRSMRLHPVRHRTHRRAPARIRRAAQRRQAQRPLLPR